MARRSKVVGDRDLIANMKGIGGAVSGRPLDALLADSLEPMRQETVANARVLRQPGTTPVGGHLDEGVVVAKVESRGKGYRRYWLTFRNRARKIAHLVEFGTLPHYQPLRRIMHPGARPKPFIRPAFEGHKSKAVEAFAAGAWKLIKAYALSNTARRRR